MFVERLPIPLVDDTNQALVNEIESLVDRITAAKKKDHIRDTKQMGTKDRRTGVPVVRT